MKKIYLFSFALLCLNLINAQNVAINSTGAVGNTSAMLDVTSTTSGLLVPRMTTAQRNAIASPAQGLLVYDLTLEQFYYYDLAATAWKALSGWTLFGNAGTNDPANPATYGTSTIGATENWMGATDAQDVVFGTNTIERLRIEKTTGDIGIGVANPTEKLHVYEINDVNKSTIYGYATQSTITFDYDNRAIVGVAKGGNATYGFAIGVTGLADQANSWKATGVYAGLTSTVPTFIAGDQALYADGNDLGYAGIFMNGNVGIGTVTPGTSRLNVTIASSDATNPTGITVANNYSGASTQYGINNTVSTDGSGIKYGIYSTVNGLAADVSSNYGMYNSLIPNGTGTAYALYNSISAVGTGVRYGMYTDVNTSVTSTSTTYGQYTTMDNDGTGGSYGLYISSIGSTTGTEYGVYVSGEDVNYYSGKTGMGTTAPQNKLDIEGGVAVGTTYSGTSTAPTNGMIIEGTVGIGTASPTSTRLECYDPGTGTVRIASFKNGASTGTEVQIGSIEYFHDYSSCTDFSSGISINFGASSSYELQTLSNSAAKPTSGSWTIYSDARLKEDVHPFMDGLKVLRSINPVYFKYNGKAKTPNEYGIGIIAQDIKEVAPYTVSTFEFMPDANDQNNIEEYYSYNPDALHYITLNAVKELDIKQTQIETIMKNVTDFGVTTINEQETYITFNNDFINNIDAGTTPVVTLTAVNSDAQLSIIEQSSKGFKVRSSKINEPVMVNWIAISKVKANSYNTNTKYSQTERQDMLDKVKLKAGSIRDKIAAENNQMQLRKNNEK